jgi:uncharacterized membrane protein YgcG
VTGQATLKGMRKLRWLLVALCILGMTDRAIAQTIAVPRKPATYVTDRPNVIGPKTQAALEKKLETYGKETGNQVVVWIGNTLPEGVTIEEYANASFNLWGLGQKEKNNGVLLMLFMKSRAMRIETGDGVRDRLTDARAAKILEAMREPLRAKEYNRAVTEATDAILATLTPPPPPPVPAAQPLRTPAAAPSRAPEITRDTLIFLIPGCVLGSVCFGAALLFIFKALRAIFSGFAQGVASARASGTTYSSDGRQDVTVTHNHYRRGWGWGSRWGSSSNATPARTTIVNHIVDTSSNDSGSSSSNDDSGNSGGSGGFSGGGSSSGGGASSSW